MTDLTGFEITSTKMTPSDIYHAITEEIYVISHTIFWKIFGRPYWGLLRARCWFTGHDICWGDRWNCEPDYCSKCYADDPQDKATLPDHLCAIYGWLVEREWRWFDQFDEWQSRHIPYKWWPSWWEY